MVGQRNNVAKILDGQGHGFPGKQEARQHNAGQKNKKGHREGLHLIFGDIGDQDADTQGGVDILPRLKSWDSSIIENSLLCRSYRRIYTFAPS